MKYTLIVACERCGKKAIFEGDTLKDPKHDQTAHDIAWKYLDYEYTNGAERRLCPSCRDKWAVFHTESIGLKNAFRANKIESAKDADFG